MFDLATFTDILINTSIWYCKYHKIPKILDTQKFAVITLKVEQDGFTLVMHPKGAEGIANSVDPDQTNPLRAV